MNYQYIKYSINQSIATIILNRPETLNSFNYAMAKETQHALQNCENEEIRCVIITGEGRGFCAGQDLSELLPSENNTNPRAIKNIVEEQYNPIITQIRNLPKPVIAMVNGVAAGAGANIALACDFVVAANSASFVQAFSKIGLIPDSAGTYTLPRLIGMAKATALMFLGEKLTATEAYNLLLIYKVVNDIDLDNETIALANKLAEMPTYALGCTKKLLNTSFDNTLEQQVKAEATFQELCGSSLDYKEGVQAFIEKRRPKFVGK
jgi:2-(1,2-epoxy-1,2-dihydrophenyl)acetyl-CoA isomerase